MTNKEYQGKPPDGVVQNNTMDHKIPGPRFLVMERTDPDLNLLKISPFLVQKTIDGTVGKVEICKKLKNGTILIKTKNLKQAEKLLELKELDRTTHVKISEHRTMNNTKGVIYCRDLIYMEDQDIIEELKTQYVAEVSRIKKYTNNERIDTGLFIFTFKTATLPEYLTIGYEKIKIRPYIPEPLQCKKCLRFGHITKNCKAEEKICANCNEKYHLEPQTKCTKQTQCKNCSSTEHTALSKSCPTYKKMKEIIKIKITENVDYKIAKETYHKRNTSETSYAQIMKKSPTEIKNSTENQKTDIQSTTAVNKSNVNPDNQKFKTPTYKKCNTRSKNIVDPHQEKKAITESSDSEYNIDDTNQPSTSKKPPNKRGRKPNLNSSAKAPNKKLKNMDIDSNIEE